MAVVIANCTICGNVALWVGGMLADFSSPTVINCTFSGNFAVRDTGGMGIDGSMPTLTNCTFTNNSAGWSGGGMFNGEDGNPTLTNCTFSGNSAGDRGGGMYNGEDSNPTMTNCTFTGNSALNRGGGMYNSTEAEPTMLNCTFSKNWAGQTGGAMFNYDCEPIILTNCILWGDRPDEIDGEGQFSITITYSDIQGGCPDTGNIDTDPCFAEPNNGDYHLKSQAGRWDANEGRWTKDDVTSLCIDAGDPATPIGYEPFPNGGIINMGVYGGTAEASKSYFGEPVCEVIVAGDINGDCIVNLKDIAFLAFHWLEDHQ